MLKLHTAIEFISAGFNIGIFVLFTLASYYKKNDKEEQITYLSFSFLALWIAIFSLSQGMINLSSNLNEGLFWHRIQHAGAVWIPATLIHFSYSVTRSSNRKVTYSAYIVSLIFLFFTFSDLLILPVQNMNAIYGYEGSPGALYDIFTLFIIYGFMISLLKLFKVKKKTQDHYLKIKLKMIIIAFYVLLSTGAIGLAIIFGFNLPLPLWNVQLP